MENLKEIILQYVEKNKHFITREELKKNLKIKGEEQTTDFLSALNSLVEEGSLFFDEKKGYKLFENNLGLAFGEIEINKSGNGFVHTKDGHTIFVDKVNLNGALNGDKVIVNSIDFGRREDYIGEVYKIVKRKTGNVIFEVIGDSYNATLVPYNKNEYVPVSINKNQLKNLMDGDLVLVKVGTNRVQGEYDSEIEKVVGRIHDPGIDLKLIFMKYDIPMDFSKEVEKEVEKLPMEVTEEELKDRVDLRDKNIITIDCDGTKDRDDAVYIEKLDNGNYKLYTSISHVSHYVSKDSHMYEEAKIRSTSHYPNNTCNPMFPSKLSNGICSLNENVDRLTRTCEMEIDKNGNVVDYKIYKSVINSKKAMKYSEVNKVLDDEFVSGYEEYKEQLKIMNELSNVLESAREKRNCLDFGIADIEVVQNKDGNIEKFAQTGEGKAQRIIENFMLITGTTIAQHYSWLPFIYRVHEVPDEVTVKSVIKLLRLSGFNIPKYNNIDETTIKGILDKISNSEEAKVIRTILLKSMKRARYDVNNIGHFALQLLEYCHFTSPIRRFTDFRIHMLIDELDTLNYNAENIIKLEQELFEIAKHASSIEKIAQDIENEALAMAMAEYMEKHIGESFNAIVTEVYPHGMFVKTDDMISGKIKFENMLDDKYHYDKDKRAIIGKNSKKKYQIGNKVCVVVKDACKETRTINFEIGKQKSLRK